MSQTVAPRKILIILPHTDGGGDTQVIYNLLYALGDHPYAFHILTARRGSLHAAFQPFGSTYAFPVDDWKLFRRILRRFSLPLYSLLKKLYGRYLIRTISPDLLYVNTVNEHEFSQVAVDSQVPLVVHMHEMGFVVTERMRGGWLEGLLARAQRIVSPAAATSAFYRDVFGVDEANVRVIHSTVSDSRRRFSGTSIRKEWGIGTDALLIGSVGSVIYRKGVDTFLRACSLLRQKMPEQKFLFLWLGGPPDGQAKSVYYRALLQSIERENLQAHVRFLPHTAEVGDFYADLDIFVLPSRMEAFPLVILEAFLAEKPVVAMDVAGIREVVDTDTGYLVRDRTPEGLAEGIAYFVQNKELRLKAGQAGRQRVLSSYEATGQALKWRQLLAEVLP